jgi:hypothetical protein
MNQLPIQCRICNQQPQFEVDTGEHPDLAKAEIRCVCGNHTKVMVKDMPQFVDGKTQVFSDMLIAARVAVLETWNNDNDPTKPTTITQERLLFEKAAYGHFIKKLLAGKIDPANAADASPDALFWKQDNGEYGVLAFNPAWWGWCAAKGLDSGN